MPAKKLQPDWKLAAVAFRPLHAMSDAAFEALLLELAAHFDPTTPQLITLVELAVLKLAEMRAYAILAEVNPRVDKEHAAAERGFWRAVGAIQTKKREEARAARMAESTEKRPASAGKKPEESPPQPESPNRGDATRGRMKGPAMNLVSFASMFQPVPPERSDDDKCPWGRRQDRPKDPGKVLREQRRRERKRERQSRKRNRAGR